MNIKVLGAHNRESRTTKYMSLLVDGILAVDAGGLTSALSFSAQQKIKAILLTHHHYDHVRDIPAIAMNFFFWNKKIHIYCRKQTYDAIASHLLNDDLYPNFMTRPKDDPTVHFTILEPLKLTRIEDYEILAVPLNHSVPAIGYQITSPDGKRIFYTGDTGPGLRDAWQYISPQVLFIEVTALNRYDEFAGRVGHLTPNLLRRELTDFRAVNGYLPKVITVHTDPGSEEEMGSELAVVALDLDCDVSSAREGMRIKL